MGERNIWGDLPADPRALRLSIEELDRAEGLCLHEIENEVSYLESVALVLHEVKRLQRKPFNLDQRAQAAVLADLPASVAQEAGEFYENAGAGRRFEMLKHEAMAVAWAQVLRPYLIGLRDHYDRQARPAPCDGSPEGSEARSGSTEGNSAVDEASSEVEAPASIVADFFSGYPEGHPRARASGIPGEGGGGDVG